MLANKVICAPKSFDDAECRRCDDAGILPDGTGWHVCTCPAGAIVLEQKDRMKR